jgi:two-component system cell cycle sensor histidine kinase/response regulator CckA
MPKIDLVITDVMMPELNGPTFITQLQKHYGNLRVVFVSGYGEDAFTAEYGTRRDFYFVAKPFTMKQLLLKVKEILKK